MARFMFVYRSSAAQHQHEMAPEQMQQIMEQWTGWISKGFQEGWMVDAGDALKLEGKIVNDEKVVSDGPFVESKEIVGGFSIIKCDSLEAATEIAKGCPAVDSPSGTIEIRELAGMGEEQ